MISTFKQPDYTTQGGTEYPLAIDHSIDVMGRIARVFAAHQQDAPNMSVRVDPGVIFTAGSLNEVAAQSTALIAAPVVNPRIDRIVVDAGTGVVAVLPGAEAANPQPPAIPGGKLPVARVQLALGITEITNAEIFDERVALGAAGGGSQRAFRAYDTPGNHTLILPASVNAFFAQLVGGGAGGARTRAGGAGSGGWALFEDLPFGAQVNIVVGAGGGGATVQSFPGGDSIVTVQGVSGQEARAGGGGRTPDGLPGVWSTAGLDHQKGWNGLVESYGGTDKKIPGWSPSPGSPYGLPGEGEDVGGQRGAVFIYW